MESDPSYWLPGSVYRRPNWRWLRASWLHANNKKPNPRIDDEWVLRGLAYLVAQDPTPAQGKDEQQANIDPALREALALAQEEPPQRRWLVEALLLTSEPLEEISRRCSLSVPTLEAYHELHFHVRPHLSASDWLMAHAVGTCVCQGFAGLPLGALWKYYALAGGPLVLDCIIASTTNTPFPRYIQESFSRDAACQEAHLGLRIELTVAALSAEVEDLLPLAEEYEQLERLDRVALGTGDSADSMLPVLEPFQKGFGSRKQPGDVTTQEPAAPSTPTAGEVTETFSAEQAIASFLAELDYF